MTLKDPKNIIRVTLTKAFGILHDITGSIFFSTKWYYYTSQLKYVFGLEGNASRVIGENFMTCLAQGEQNVITPLGTNNSNFRLARDQVVHFWNRSKYLFASRDKQIWEF